MGYRTHQITRVIEKYPLDTDTYMLKVDGNQGESKWLVITHAELLAIKAVLAIGDSE